MPMVAAAAAAVFTAAGTFAASVGAATLASVGLGSLATMGIASFTGSLTIGALVGAVQIGGMAMSLFSAAKKPKAGAGGGSPLAFKSDPNAYIPFVAGGPIGVGGNMVFAQTAGYKNKWLNYQAVLSHGGPCASVSPFTANDEQVNFTNPGESGQGATGRYKDRMWQRTALGVVGAAATIITASGTNDTPLNNNGNPPEWTAQHKLSGMANASWTLLADPERYPQVPKPLWLVRGGPVYDPRKDSTMPGGVGPQRWNDRATWSTDGNQNPYLQAMTFALGHTYNGVRVGGVGLPIAGIDVPAFVNGANVADANGWKIAWQWHTGMRKWDVFATMLQAGAGIPLVRGSQLSCMVDTPRVSVGTITDADLRGDFSVTGCSSIRDRKNAIVPRAKSAAHKWTVQPWGRVTSAVYVAEDGGDDRTLELEYESVEGGAQVRQLAALELANLREGLAATIPVSASFLKYRAGDCLTVNAGSTLLNGQKVVVVKRDFDARSRVVTLTVRSETDGKHAWALGQADDPPPSPSLTGADPTVIQPPAPGAWVSTPGQAPGGGTGGGLPQVPVIVVAPPIPAVPVTPGNPDTSSGAFSDDSAATHVLVRYRRTGLNPATGVVYPWAGPQEFPARSDRLELTGLAPGVTYEVEVSYRVRGVPSAWTRTNDVTTGGLLATNTAAVGGRAATQVLTELDAVPGQIAAAEAAANAALGVATANTNLALAALDLRVDDVEADIDDPTTGLKVRVGQNEVATAAGASRITVVEQSINTPATGILARTALLETATANLQTGKADASRVTVVEARISGGVLNAGNQDFLDGLNGYDLQSAVTVGTVGGRPHVVSGSQASHQFFGQYRHPFDPARKYRIAASYWTGAGGIGSQLLLGFRACDESGAYLTHTPGSNAYMIVATQAAGAGWVDYLSPVIEAQGGPYGFGYPPGTKSLVTVGLTNYNASATPWGLDFIRVLDVTAAEAAVTLGARATSLETATANLQTGKADASRVTTLEAVAKVAAANALPYDFSDLGQNWRRGTSGSPASSVSLATTPGLATFQNVATVGPTLRQTIAAGSNDTVTTLGVARVEPGRRYRMTARARRLSGGAAASLTIYAIGLTSEYADAPGGGAYAQAAVTLTNVNSFYSVAVEIDGSAALLAGGVFLRATALLIADAEAATLFELDTIRLEEVTADVSLAARATSLETATANLQTGKADASRVTVVEARLNTGLLSPNSHFDDGLAGWDNGTVGAYPAGSVQSIYQGRRNVYVPPANTPVNIFSRNFIPVDTARKYRIRAGVWFEAGAGNTTMYLGLRARDAAGNVLPSNPGSYMYALVLGAVGPLVSGWRDLRSDVGTDNVPDGGGLPITGEGTGLWSIFPVGTKSVELLGFLNYDSGPRQVALDYFYLEDMTADAADTALAARLTIEEAASVDLRGRTYARWALGAAVPGAAAFIEARAEVTPGAAATSSVAIGARQFAVYNQAGAAWLKALSVEGGNVVLTGGLQAGAFIRLGNGQGWPVALKGVDFNAADGGVVAFGTDLGSLPSLTFAMNNLLPLAAGETYDVKATGLTATGFTLSAKINVPGTPSAYNDTASTATSAFGAGGLYINRSGGVSADGTYRVKGTGMNRHDIVGDPGGALQEDTYDYVSAPVQVWALKSGTWQFIAGAYVNSMVDRRNYGAGFQSVTGSWSMDETLQLGDNVSAVGIRHGEHGTYAYVATFTNLMYTAAGAPGGVRTALASGATTKIRVQPQ